MSDHSNQCEELSNTKEPCSATRVFPCLYHCKKMLCLQHLAEHEKHLEKQIQFQKQLQELWHSYQILFDETKVQQQYEALRIKLENYHQMKKDIPALLLLNSFSDSNEADEKLHRAMETIRRAIEHEIRAKAIFHGMDPTLERNMNEREENQITIDYPSLSLSINTNDESEIADSVPSLSNHNGSSPPNEHEQTEDDCHQPMDQHYEQEPMDDMENEDQTTDTISFLDANRITPNRKVRAYDFRGVCPLTQNGVFGIDTEIHGIRLCSKKSSENPRAFRLHEHFRRVHHLTSLASLALVRAMIAGEDPWTKVLFDSHHSILNMEELRHVSCPMEKPLLNYPDLDLFNCPCYETKQVRHLREHLRRVHKFSNRAASFIVKAVKCNRPIHSIQFPHWINILENES